MDTYINIFHSGGQNSKYAEILGAFAHKHVLVVGDIMLDEYLWGKVRRISPEAPVPILEIIKKSYMPGGAANTAANITSLGGIAFLGGVVGKDHHAQILRRLLRERKVDMGGLLVEPTRPTTTKMRVSATSQQIVRIDSEDRRHLPISLETELITWVSSSIVKTEACIISDYNKGVLSPSILHQIISNARKVGIPVVVDPKGKNFTKYQGATLITPNLLEAEEATSREIKNESDLCEVGTDLCQRLDGTAVLITRGENGMTLFQHGVSPINIPGIKREVSDIIGAGDTVVSCLALAIASGANLEQAANIANLTASIVISKVGTATATVEELLCAIR